MKLLVIFISLSVIAGAFLLGNRFARVSDTHGSSQEIIYPQTPKPDFTGILEKLYPHIERNVIDAYSERVNALNKKYGYGEALTEEQREQQGTQATMESYAVELKQIQQELGIYEKLQQQNPNPVDAIPPPLMGVPSASEETPTFKGATPPLQPAPANAGTMPPPAPVIMPTNTYKQATPPLQKGTVPPAPAAPVF